VLGSGRAPGWIEAGGGGRAAIHPFSDLSESEELLRAHVERRSSRPIRARQASDVKRGLLPVSIYPALGARIIARPRPLLEPKGSPLEGIPAAPTLVRSPTLSREPLSCFDFDLECCVCDNGWRQVVPVFEW
jgi:hypothetical protein